jgi:ceramide glucosyltransferase
MLRELFFIAIIVFAGTGGELCATRAMKQVGEVTHFTPRHILRAMLHAFRVGWMWFGLFLMAVSFFALLTLLSWENVSFVVPVTALSYAAGALGGKLFLGETVSPRRWAGVSLVCVGVAMVWVEQGNPAWLHAARWLVLALAIGPFGYYILAITSALRFFRNRPPVSNNFAPPVSVLKPIRGLDREAYENYSSFCVQDYPEFEILFCVPDENDPVIPILERVMRDHPKCPARLLIGAEQLGTSNKVNKMVRMVREAKYDILVISDSDIRVGPGYLRAVAAPFRDPNVGAVTCLYRGLTDGSFVSELEALGNTSEFDAGVLSAWALGGVDFTLGATMACTRRHLAEIGGFEAMVDHFTDDYELGHRIHALGHRVELTTYPVFTVFPKQTLGECFAHQVRWNLTMRHAQPWGHFGLIFTHGLPWALLAAAIAPSAWISIAYLAGYVVLRGTMAWTVGVWGVGDPLLRRKMWMVPIRDAFAFVVWLTSFFKRRVIWRGSYYYIRENRLVPADPPPARG